MKENDFSTIDETNYESRNELFSVIIKSAYQNCFKNGISLKRTNIIFVFLFFLFLFPKLRRLAKEKHFATIEEMKRRHKSIFFLKRIALKKKMDVTIDK